jgi:hypothetical protein
VAHNEYKLLATVEMQFGELPEVKCNVSELNQVFLNLIINAAHAVQDSGKDSATGVIAIRSSAAHGMVEVAIRDNGYGIALEHANKVFDPFFTTKVVGPRELGLAGDNRIEDWYRNGLSRADRVSQVREGALSHMDWSEPEGPTSSAGRPGHLITAIADSFFGGGKALCHDCDLPIPSTVFARRKRSPPWE